MAKRRIPAIEYRRPSRRHDRPLIQSITGDDDETIEVNEADLFEPRWTIDLRLLVGLVIVAIVVIAFFTSRPHDDGWVFIWISHTFIGTFIGFLAVIFGWQLFDPDVKN